MNKRQLDMLERAFCAEIASALSGSFGIIQTRSKVAQELVGMGMFKKTKRTLGEGGPFPVVIEGFELTDAGRLAYCISDRCKGEEAT